MVINFENEIINKVNISISHGLSRLLALSLRLQWRRYNHQHDMGIQVDVHRGFPRAAILNDVDDAITGDAVMARSKQLAQPQRRSVIEFGEFKAEFKNIKNTFRGLPSRQRTFSVSVWKPIVHGGNMLLQRSVPRA